MELKETAKQILDIFEVDSVAELSEVLPEILIQKDKDEYLSRYIDIVGVEGRDMLQSAYQFWLADRAGKKQDYTPKSLGRLAAALAPDDVKTIFDACAGSGALSIACWEMNQNLEFVCWELDGRVIGFLLLNLALRNMSAIVVHGNLLAGEIYKSYTLTPGNQFSSVKETGLVMPKCDLVVSNPPFNLKWDAVPIQFKGETVTPPASNANYAFIIKSLIEADTDQGIFILPAGALNPNSSTEHECRAVLERNRLIRAVVYNAGDMFDSTSIRTQCLVIAPNSEQVSFVDNAENFAVEIRAQRGEDHMSNRVYKKEFKIYDDACIGRVVKAIASGENIPGFCKTVEVEKATACNFKKYDIIEIPKYEIERRDIKDIVNDLNRIYEEKNKLKLTVNITVAEKYNLLEAAKLQSTENTNLKEVNSLLRHLGADELTGDKYLTLSRNAGEFKFENKNKKDISTIIEQMLPLYMQHIRYLNNCESQYLKELQNTLLELLMTGKVDTTELEG